MKKIDVAELLRNCPKGMELDCTMYDRVTFDEVTTVIGFDDKKRVKIILSTHYSDGTKDEINLTEYGTYTYDETAKCVIFPKGKTTWEGFQRPFKDGDVVAFDIEEDSQLFIFKEYVHNHDYARSAKCYMMLNCDGEIDFEGDYYVERFATEEEKEKLFDSIKAHGYKWNPETKTLEKLVEPQFKDGDIVTCKDGGLLVACIYKERKNTESFNHHIALYKGCLDVLVNGEIVLTDDKLRFATEEEKAKLFKAIKYKGYKWNSKTKTLEKLPKFKVGDTITNGKISITIGYIDDKYYYEVSRNIAHRLFIENQDEWNLVPDKFNLTTLVPFESRVLVRNDKDSYWRPSIFGCYIKDMTMPYYVLGGTCWRYCIPYEGNEYLRGKTDDCKECFKTWK